MAENLLGTDWYRTEKGVQEVISNYYSRSINFQDISLSSILSNRINQLKELYRVVFDSEKRFYNTFSITRGFEPKEALKILQEKVIAWNKSGTQNLISSDAHQTVINILTNPNYRSLTLEELNDIINELFQPSGELYDTNEELTVEMVLDILNRELEDLELSKFRSSSSKNITNSGDKSLYWITITDGKIKIDGSIDANRKSRIKKAIQNLIDKKGATTTLSNKKVIGGDSERNIDMLRQVILSLITDSGARNIVSEELSIGRIDKFNLARDYGVIKGFLGEVYWSSFFKYLGADSIPVGDEKDIISKGSVAIDLVINKFGFQVKNFNFKSDGSIQFGTRGGLKDVGTLIRKRMELREGDSLGDLLLGLYGSYGFNQDYSDGEFADTREQLEKLVNGGLDDIFTYFIDRIIHLDAQQDAQILKESEAFTPDRKTLFNSFFVIGEKIVPSSQILLTIINQLENTTIGPRAKFETTKVAIKEGATTHKSLIENPQDNFTWNLLKMANQVQIGYKIDLNIDDILAKAYNQIL